MQIECQLLILEKDIRLTLRKKMSENQQGKILSGETKKKISDSHTGKVKSKKHLEKLSSYLLDMYKVDAGTQ